jgi:DNA-binding IscR family transcriptional regulator
MTASDDFLFADVLMDQKFRVTTEILEQFVSNPSQELSAARLASHTGRTAREVNQICKKLQLIGLVEPVKPATKGWKLMCDPNMITLEDVYRGVLATAEATPVRETGDAADEVADRAVDPARSVDLLIMQATMEVNQSIFRHLRQFSLGRPRHTQFSSSRR